MRPTIATIALVAALFAAPTLPGAFAWHGAEEPIVDTVPFEGKHWVAWRFTLAAPGNVVVEGTFTAKDVETAGFGATLMDGDGSDADQGWVLQQFSSRYVFVDIGDGAPVIDYHEGLANSPHSGALTWPNRPAGEYIAVAIATASGEVGEGELTLRASGGATLLGKTEGTSAFAAVARDFAGTANVRAEATAMGTVIVDAENTQSIENRLFGFYWRHPSTSANPLHTVTCTIDYAGPDGGGTGARWYFIDSGPPGTYTFHVPHCVDAGGWLFRTQLFVVGADVVLPGRELQLDH